MKLLNLSLILVMLLFSFCKTEDYEPGKESFKLNIADNQLGSVTVSPFLESYEENTEVTLTATPNSGYSFKCWTINSETVQQKEINLVMNCNYTVTAEFIKNDGSSYTINYSYNTQQGRIELNPAMNSYPAGTTIEIKALPKDGYEFSHWSGISATAASFAFDINSNLDIEAFFQIAGEKGDTKANFDMEIIYEEEGKWAVNAELEDDEGEGISDATITVAGTTLTANNFFIGDYDGNLTNLVPGEEVTVSIKTTDLPLQEYKVIVPPVFTNDPDIAAEEKNGEIVFTWQKLDCSGYFIAKKVENKAQTSSVTLSRFQNEPISGNTYTTTRQALLNDNVYVSFTPYYFQVWVRSANIYKNLEGLSSRSRILLIGSKTRYSISNKPKQ